MYKRNSVRTVDCFLQLCRIILIPTKKEHSAASTLRAVIIPLSTLTPNNTGAKHEGHPAKYDPRDRIECNRPAPEFSPGFTSGTILGYWNFEAASCSHQHDRGHPICVPFVPKGIRHSFWKSPNHHVLAWHWFLLAAKWLETRLLRIVLSLLHIIWNVGRFRA